jgi:hypothetical protein
MLQATAPSPMTGVTPPAPAIRPRRPFVFTFAIRDACSPAETLIPGDVTTIEVVDGKRQSGAHGDWFAARVPAVPSETGPVRVAGARPGDTLEVEVHAISPREKTAGSPLLVAVSCVGSRPGEGIPHVAIPVGGVAHLPALRHGGPLSFGPVLIRQDSAAENVWEAIAACVAVRCTVVDRRWIKE